MYVIVMCDNKDILNLKFEFELTNKNYTDVACTLAITYIKGEN